MQKRKSFLMKLLVLLTVVFCTFALAFGMVGCAAENGKDGKDGVGIAKVEIVDGELKITLTDGNQVTGSIEGEGSLSSKCEHSMIESELRPGTCAQEALTLKYCTKCLGSIVAVGEKDKDVHGKYVWTDGDEYYQEFKQDIEPYEQTEAEQEKGTCPRGLCKDCNNVIDTHKYVETSIYESDPCTKEGLHSIACEKCSFVKELSKAAPTGHNYKVVGNNHEDDSKDDFKVELVCETCNDVIYATAELVEEKVATCAEKGFNIFEYTYNNGIDKEEWPDAYVEVTAEIKDENENIDVHVLTDGTEANTLYFQSNKVSGKVERYDVEKQDALDALFDAKLINWEGDDEPENCKSNNQAIFTCDCCETPVVIKLTAKHDYTETKKDCDTNGFYKCSVCDDKYTTEEQKATGHNWTFKSANVENNTITVECSICKGTEEGTRTVEAERDTTLDYTAKDCSEVNKHGYKTKNLTNGVTADIVVVNGTADVATEKLHVVAGTTETFYAGNNVDGKPYKYNAVFADVKYWEEGQKGTCSDDRKVIFTCGVCETQVTINMYGEHTLVVSDEHPENTVAPTHTKRGYTTQYCTACGKDVVIDSMSKDATGHNYVVDSDSLAQFKASHAENVTVKFVCDCTEEGNVINVPAKLVDTKNATGCLTGKHYYYDFVKEYYVQAAGDEEGEATLKVKFSDDATVDVVNGAHTIGDFTYEVSHGAYAFEDDPAIATLINNGISWSEGIEGTCEDPNDAIFYCEGCETWISFELYGPHKFDKPETDKVTAATCQAPGKIEKQCSECNQWEEFDGEDQLEHEITWTYNDTVVNGKGAEVYVNDNGTPDDLTDDYLVGVVLGSATGTCSNEGCTADDLFATVTYVLDDATCCESGLITVTYTYGEQQLKVETKTIENSENHATDNKAIYYVEFKSGAAKTVYEFIKCETSDGLVKVAVYEVVADELPESAQDVKVVYNQDGIQVVLYNGSAYIVEAQQAE